MRTTLHIGTPKTGSLGFQQFLARNRSVLADNRILYSRVLGEQTHLVLPVVAQGFVGGSPIHRRLGIRKQPDLKRLKESAERDFADEVAGQRPTHLILSSEHLSSRCVTDENFAALKRLLGATVTGELELVLYLRPQVELALALYATMLRQGRTMEVDAFLESRLEKPVTFDYAAIIDRWSAAFPKASLRVRSFKKAAALPNGPVDDFRALCGISHLDVMSPPRPQKLDGMGGWSAELLRQMNLRAEAIPAAVAAEVKKWLAKNLPGGGIVPDMAQARRFQDHFTEGNVQVVERFFADDRTALDPDWDKIATARQQVPTKDQVIALIAATTGKVLSAAAEFDTDNISPEVLARRIEEISQRNLRAGPRRKAKGKARRKVYD